MHVALGVHLCLHLDIFMIELPLSSRLSISICLFWLMLKTGHDPLSSHVERLMRMLSKTGRGAGPGLGLLGLKHVQELC